MSKTKWSKNPNAKQRRRNALDRLEYQLSTGNKVGKAGETFPLTEKDISRIKAEIDTLKPRV